MTLQLYTWLIIYLLELSARLELAIVVYKTTVLPVKLRKHARNMFELLDTDTKPSVTNTFPETFSTSW